MASPPVLVIKSTRYHNLLERLLVLVPNAQVLGIVRDPRASIHSWLSNPKEFPADADPMIEWRTGACRKSGVGEYWGFEDWKTVASEYLRLSRRFPSRFHLTRYEKWVNGPDAELAPVLSALSLPPSPQTSAFMRESQQSHHDHPRAVFKLPELTDRWRAELDARIAAAIEGELAGSELARFLT